MKLQKFVLFSLMLVSMGSQASFAEDDSAHSRAVPFTTSKTFNSDVLLSSTPVLVDFFATWCGPCKMMAPVVKDAAENYSGRVKVFRVDIDKDPQLAAQYGIQAVPTLELFSGGKPVRTTIGVITPNELSADLSSVLTHSTKIGTTSKNRPM